MYNDRIGPMLTDLYELTMGASYFAHRMSSDATFSLFIRNHTPNRNYYIAVGLDDILNELQALQFTDEDVCYLESVDLFSKDYLEYLTKFRFSGTVHAVPEGTIVFPDEPILEITAPVIEAQLVETLVLNTVGFQTLVATKAARCIQVAGGRPLIDFSLRRTHGHHAGIKVARSTYLAGFAGTSNILAGKLYDIPVSGTMAHSYITAFETETAAFAAYAETFPDNTILLIDTYDTEAGAKKAVTAAQNLKNRGKKLIGVRLDSGDMVALSRKVRKILDDAGFQDVKIFASSGFDEYKIARVLSKKAMIDAFGVGTKVGVSADRPYLDIVYKMVRFGDRNVRKISPGKTTLAGEKQVFRKCVPDGRYQEDTIGVRDEAIEDTTPLLENVMVNGRRLQPPVPLKELRTRCQKNVSLLDDDYKRIDTQEIYPVKLSPRLRALQERI